MHRKSPEMRHLGTFYTVSHVEGLGYHYGNLMRGERTARPAPAGAVCS